jgi:DNA-binding CsgD family transcriptional regulator
MKSTRYSSQIKELLSGLETKNLIFRKQKEIELKENEILAEKNNKNRLVLFGVILILSLGFLVAYFISRKVYIEKQFIITEQRERIANSNLEHKKIELAMLSTNIVKENELISSISQDLKNYVSLLKSEKEQKLFVPLMNKLNIELKDKNKDESYSDQFNAAYPGYLESLINYHPQLSASELKVCTFLRLNLNSKEISEILNISVRSVESRRYRLRKKLKLSKETDLVNYLISLSNSIT